MDDVRSNRSVVGFVAVLLITALLAVIPGSSAEAHAQYDGADETVTVTSANTYRLPPACVGTRGLVEFGDALGFWEAEIECMAAYGITTGFPDGTYRPGLPVKRQQMALFIARLAAQATGGELQIPTFSDDAFDDIAGINPPEARDAINWLADLGITTGVTADRFAPGAWVTRQQMASFIARAHVALGVELPDPSAPTAFTDTAVIAEVHRDNVLTLHAAGVVKGRVDGTYDPRGSVRRGQMSGFIVRSIGVLDDQGLWAGNLPTPIPHFTVGPAVNAMGGYEWPAEVSLTLASSAPGNPEQTVQTSTEGDFHLDLNEVWDPIASGDVITVTYTPDNGATIVKTLTVSSLTVTNVDVDASTVSGTADYGHPTNLNEVVVAVYGEIDWIAARHVEVQPDGTWIADFSSPPEPDRGEGVLTFDADTYGDVFQHNHTGDATFANWHAPDVYEPTFGYNTGGLIQSDGWPAGVPVTVATSAEGNPEQTVITGAEDSDWPGFIRLPLDDVWEPVQPGEVITLTHVPDVGPAIVKTLTVSSLTVTSVDVDAKTVSGIADYGHPTNLDEVWVTMPGDDYWAANWRLVDVQPDGTWTADFSYLPDPDRGEGLPTFDPPYTGGEAFQHNRTGDTTYIRWGAGPPE
jgi:hypothetical protein